MGCIWNSTKKRGRIYFYESGSLAFITPGLDQYDKWIDFSKKNPVVAVETSIGKLNILGRVEFYDTGSIGSVKVKRLETLSPYDDLDGRYKVKNIEFFENGQLAKEEYAKSKVFETSIGELISVDNETIEYHSDGSLHSLINKELVLINVLDQMAAIPMRAKISFHKNGKIKYFETSTDMTFTVGNTSYTPKKVSEIIGVGLSEDGKVTRIRTSDIESGLAHFESDFLNKWDLTITDFYEDGKPKKIINNRYPVNTYFLPPSGKFIFFINTDATYGRRNNLYIFNEISNNKVSMREISVKTYGTLEKPGYLANIYFDKNEKISRMEYYKVSDLDFINKYSPTLEYAIVVDADFNFLTDK